jgi:Pyruvate/2-oxoacid:ferredoxin oxidoreductase gamma subunit
MHVELPWIVFPLQPEKDSSRQNYYPHSYPSYVDYLSVLAQMIVPTERKSVSYGTLAVLPPDYVWPQEKRQTKVVFY